MATVGVLCARARVEEKAIMTALAEAGIVSALFPPADEPLPVGPLPTVASGRAFPVPQLVVDRHPNRQIARAVLATCRALGVPALCAGIAGTGDRLDVASALAASSLPRPFTALCTSEDAALEAVAELGLPATLLPLDLKSPAIELMDQDAAEAILEHRAVLGGTEGSLSLIQAGSPAPNSVATLIVVDGSAVTIEAVNGVTVPDQARRLAEQAAEALNADLVAITIAMDSRQPLVWDVRPVPDFRKAMPITELTVPEAITQAVERRLDGAVVAPPSAEQQDWSRIRLHGHKPGQGTRRDLVISA
jgi:[lysine-biosynthesis-protein LysW]--L-2-aminoadipate ligase